MFQKDGEYDAQVLFYCSFLVSCYELPPVSSFEVFFVIANMNSLETKHRRRSAKRMKKDENLYFEGYADLQCHLMMILDSPRTNAYKRAIFDSAEKLRNKIVLDVGAGTEFLSTRFSEIVFSIGILSIFASQAGAAKGLVHSFSIAMRANNLFLLVVHAVEAADVHNHLVDIIRANKLENAIEVHSVRVEDLYLETKVDCILSEWMGYGLFCEWMLRSVVHARDQWLNAGGLMIPERARVIIAPVVETEYLKDRTRSWFMVRDRFNVNMDIMARVEAENSRGRLIVHQVFPEEVAGRQAEVLNVDLYTIKDSDLSQLKGHFSCECYGNCKVFGFCMWFVVDMPAGVTLDTSPYAEVTHWLQIAMYIKPFKVDQGKVIAGSLSVQQHPEDERNTVSNEREAHTCIATLRLLFTIGMVVCTDRVRMCLVYLQKLQQAASLFAGMFSLTLAFLFCALLGAKSSSSTKIDCPKAVTFGRGPPGNCTKFSDPNNRPKSKLESWFTKEMFDDLFPKANLGWGPHDCSPYNYDSFVIAARYFPQFAIEAPRNGYTAEQNYKRDLAAFFAHAVQETGENDASLYSKYGRKDEADECFYRGGFYNWFEGGPTSQFLPAYAPGHHPMDGDLCNAAGKYCVSNAEQDYFYPCNQEKSKYYYKGCYFGRGPIQLSYNFNYGQFGNWLRQNGVNVDLLKHPNLLMTKTDPPLAIMGSIWFYMTPQPPKPAMHDIVMGQWEPGYNNRAAGYSGPIFGPTSLIINNECNGEDQSEPGGPGESRRIKAFKWFCKYFNVPAGEQRHLTCKGMPTTLDMIGGKKSFQPDWSSTWKAEPCKCAPADYGGMIAYYEPGRYPDRFVALNEQAAKRCIQTIYLNPSIVFFLAVALSKICFCLNGTKCAEGNCDTKAECPKAQKFGSGPAASCSKPKDPNQLAKSKLESWFTKEMFNDLFPKANLGWGPNECSPYSYESFVIAARYFPEFATEAPNNGYTAEQNYKRDLAAFFAHAVQETGENDASLYDQLSNEQASNCYYRGGFFNWFEGGPTSLFLPSSSPGYDPKDGEVCNAQGRYCSSSAELDYFYPCHKEMSDQYYKGCYFGRGAIQLSYNFNYGQFGDWLQNNGVDVDLLKHPNLLMTKTDPPLAIMGSIWFYMTPQPPKPAMHDIIMGTRGQWYPGDKNKAAGYSGPIFGPTSLIINNECNGEDSKDPGGPGESRRIKAFKWFCKYFNVPAGEQRHLTCKGMPTTLDMIAGKKSLQPDWSSTWKSEPCKCAPADYGGMIPYYEAGRYPDRFVAMNEQNAKRCVETIYDNPSMYSMTAETSLCLTVKP
ncbi:hypothetical protein M513_11522 [Trichuris suis]|uniref:Glycoside hydrolase family 19 catalytic domain-containing protein n=1 Tax=Trichuris suis TaxID=68888 RepID=A0A085LRK7_9BILA|nr:hypothetical protein M513_11522 [Trichuris suis]